MTALWWALWTAVAVALAWQVRRALREPLERDRIVAQARRTTRPAALDTEPGIDLALQDECELLWSIPSDSPGWDRLRAAIRDEQQKGETP